jgi:hypothetical protein
MFELLPENSYSQKAVRWGLVVSLLFITTRVFGIVRHHDEDSLINVLLGVAMLFIWGTRRREPPIGRAADSKAAR